MKTALMVAVPALIVIAVLWTLNREHRLRVDAEGREERAQLALRGVTAADEVSISALKDQLNAAVKADPPLGEEVEKVKRAAPSARPTAVAHFQTAPAAVAQDAAPRLPACEGVYVPDGAGGFSCRPAPGAPAQPACLLAPGDTGSFRVDQVVLKTDRGSSIVAGTAEFWRETPSRSRLASGKFSSALSGVETLQAPSEPRWGLEVGGLCTRDGCGPGLGVLLPPFRVPLLGLRAEGRADVLAGPALGAAGWLGVRW